MTTFYAWDPGDERSTARSYRTSCHESAAELWSADVAEEADDLVIERATVMVAKEEEEPIEMLVTGSVRVEYHARKKVCS